MAKYFVYVSVTFTLFTHTHTVNENLCSPCDESMTNQILFRIIVDIIFVIVHMSFSLVCVLIHNHITIQASVTNVKYLWCKVVWLLTSI